MRLCNCFSLASALVLAGGIAQAQSVVSARSGLVHYVEGRVLLADREIDPKFGQFPEVAPGQVLRTEEGRAEILLAPGVFLRVAENSSIRMILNELTDTRIEVLSGRAMVESTSEVIKEDSVELQLRGSSVRILKNGLYEFCADPASLRVYQGEARVQSGNSVESVSRGHELPLNAAAKPRKFDLTDTDDLYSWTARRSSYLAAANISSAQTVAGMGYGGGYSAAFGYPVGLYGCGGWTPNPWFGMYTYVPCFDLYLNPFGYEFFSPYTVGYIVPTLGGGGTPGKPRRPGKPIRLPGPRPRPVPASSPYRLAAIHAASHAAVAAAVQHRAMADRALAPAAVAEAARDPRRVHWRGTPLPTAAAVPLVADTGNRRGLPVAALVVLDRQTGLVRRHRECNFPFRGAEPDRRAIHASAVVGVENREAAGAEKLVSRED